MFVIVNEVRDQGREDKNDSYGVIGLSIPPPSVDHSTNKNKNKIFIFIYNNDKLFTTTRKFNNI